MWPAARYQSNLRILINARRRIVVALALAVSFAGLARAEDKKEFDKTKLIVTWNIIKAEGAPVGALVEFAKDGKMIVSFEMDGKQIKVEGTYKLEGDKLHTVMSFEGNEMKDVDTIKSLTEDKLSLIDKDDKPAELEKVKKK
jgi:uncharacterized protein (TIGR03066 family)